MSRPDRFPGRILVFEETCAARRPGDLAASLLDEGWAMLASIVEDLARLQRVERVELLLDTELAPRGAALGPKVSVVTTDSGRVVESFERRAGTCDVTLVIAPELDDALSAWSRRVVAAGGRLLGSTPQAIELTADKVLCTRHLATAGVPIPRLVPLPSNEPVGRGAASLEPASFPAVLKPRRGAGALWTYRVDRSGDLPRVVATARAAGAPDDLVLGPIVDGVPVSVSFLVTANAVIALEPGYQQVELDGDQYRYRGGRMPLDSAGLRQRAIRLARRAVESIDGLWGFVGVDLILDHGPQRHAQPRTVDAMDRVLELNPRLTTSYLGLRQVHRSWNIAEQWLRAPLEPRASLRLPLEAPRDSVGVVRFGPARVGADRPRTGGERR